MYALFDGNGLPTVVCSDSKYIDDFLAQKYQDLINRYPTRSAWDHSRFGNELQFVSAYMSHIYILRTPEDVNFNSLQQTRNNAINRNYARIHYGAQEQRTENQRIVLAEVYAPLGIEDATTEFMDKSYDPVVVGATVTATITRRGLVNTGAVVSVSKHHYEHLTQRPLETIVEHLRGLRYIRVSVPGRGGVNMAVSSLGDFRKNDIVEQRNIITLTNNIFE